MPYDLDPEYLTAIEPYLDILSKAPKLPVGDVEGRRSGVNELFDLLMPAWPEAKHVSRDITVVQTSDGHDVPVHIFRKVSSDPFVSATSLGGLNGAVMYIHGGGYFALTASHYAKVISLLVSRTGVTVLAPDYRLAPEHAYPTPFEDCWTVLKWLSGNAESVGVDSSRLAVFGDSAGGGLSAALAIKARDEDLNPPLKRFMLVGAMLDDRTTAVNQSHIDGVATWSDDDNQTGWAAYLGKEMVNSQEKDEVSVYAAPGRINVEDTKGLSSAYIEVPHIDVFLQENLEFARKLSKGGIEVELHVWPGVPHSFELFAPNISMTELALNCRVNAWKKL